MCGRYTLKLVDRIVDHFEIVEVPVPLFGPRYNIAPTQQIPIVRATPEGTRELANGHWGLIPSWASDRAIGNRLINARGETAFEKPAFRKAMSQRRCLIPADGFYEWKRLAGPNGPKQPYYIQLKTGGLFAFAGLWERWTDPTGQTIDSCTVLTTSPNELMSGLHDRMPVIVSPGQYGPWLDPNAGVEVIRSLLAPYPSDQMEAWPVSTRVNSPANEERACTDRAEVLPVPEKKKARRAKDDAQGQLF